MGKNGIKRGMTRRGFTAGAAGTGLLIGSAAPAVWAQGNRELRVGVFGGDFGNLSPVIRYDIQGGLVVYNVFDNLVDIDYASRAIVPRWRSNGPIPIR